MLRLPETQTDPVMEVKDFDSDQDLIDIQMRLTQKQLEEVQDLADFHGQSLALLTRSLSTLGTRVSSLDPSRHISMRHTRSHTRHTRERRDCAAQTRDSLRRETSQRLCRLPTRRTRETGCRCAAVFYCLVSWLSATCGFSAFIPASGILFYSCLEFANYASSAV